MTTSKQIYRDVELDTKKVLRDADGHALDDDLGNAGDEIRKGLGDAGDAARRGLGDAGDAVRKTGDQVHRELHHPADRPLDDDPV